MNDTRKSIMDAIHDGRVNMRPRWHFLLLSTLTALGIVIAFLAVLYATSLLVFFLRESGALYLPGFGGRGWWDLMRSLPFSILALLLLFILVLEYLVRRYAFVYKKPLLVSVFVILALVIGGGFGIAQTPLHGQLVLLARHGQLPPPMDGLYKPPFTMHPEDVYQGIIIEIRDREFLMTEHRHGTTTVRVTPRTRLPAGEDFSVGDMILVIGDKAEGASIEAFGIREMAHGEMQ